MFKFKDPWIHEHKNPFTHTDEWINVQMRLHMRTRTVHSQSLSPIWKRLQWQSHSTTVLLGISSFSASEHHLGEKQLCFSEGRAPRDEFGFWLNVFLAAGFEMPLQLQIDSSGFLCFYDLSFSIRLRRESREPSSPPGPWKIEIALLEKIMCVIFIYSHVT